MNDQPASVQAAVVLENRLTSMEAELRHMGQQHTLTNKMLEQLVERVGIQNGRVGKTEDALRELRKHITDHEELIAKPRWASFETVKTKVEAMWNEFSVKGIVEEKRERFWTMLKRRLDLIAVCVAIFLSINGERIIEILGGK